MTVEGLYIFKQAPALSAELRAGSPDVSEAVGVSIDASKLLGSTPDVDAATDSLTKQFNALAELGYDGRLFVEPPAAVSFGDITDAAEGKRPHSVSPMYRYPNLWTPGTETNSYTPEELDAAPTDALARLAVFNADRETGADPILHFLNMPFDDKYREGAPQTQLEALTAAQAKFEKQHPQAMLQSLGHRAAAMLVLMDRIRGVETVNPQSDDYILNTGYVRIPDLGRRSVGGGSVVGYVDSGGGRLELDGSSGIADPYGGVGLVAGLKELDPQAS